MSLREQLCSSQQRCKAFEAELGQRDRLLVDKCDQLKLTEAQVRSILS